MREYWCVIFLIAGCLGQNLGPIGGQNGGQSGPGLGGISGSGIGTNNLQQGLPGVPIPGVPGVPIPGVPNLPLPGVGNGNDGTGGTPSPIALPNLLNLTGTPQNVNRPCRRYDIQCVRYFFKDHSKCKKPYGKVPDPLYRAISNQFYPAYNLSISFLNGFYFGFNTGRIEDLYVNRETDKVVLTIEFRELRLSSRDSFFRYYRRAREPIITYGYNNIQFKSLVVTATIPQVNDLRLDKADVFGYSNELPVIVLDPKLGESSDPVVAKSFAALKLDVPTTTTEFLLSEAAYYAAVYIQNVICDFGLKLI